MTEVFVAHSPDLCCLCGSPEKLTGEHKIKASIIRSLFSGKPMMIGSFNGGDRLRLAQSSKSKALHFRSKICAACNSTRTQDADLEFARFDKVARELLVQGVDPASAFDYPRYTVDSAPYLNAFRYLAKVLACHIAEADGPRFTALVDFAIGRSNVNYVRARMGVDNQFRFWFENTGDPEFAGHGGLRVTFSKRTGLVNGLASSLTHGALRYEFGVEFNWVIGLLLRLRHPLFNQRLVKARREAFAAVIAESRHTERGIDCGRLRSAKEDHSLE